MVALGAQQAVVVEVAHLPSSAVAAEVAQLPSLAVVAVVEVEGLRGR